MTLPIGSPTTLDSIDDLPKDELRHILRHFSAPPPPSDIHKQELRLANIPPLKQLPNNLIPHFYDPYVIPPRLYLGFRFDRDQAVKNAISRGYTANGMPPGTPPSSLPCSSFLDKLIRRETGYEMRHELVLSGNGERHLESIYALASNYDGQNMLKMKQLIKVAEILGFPVEDLRWWVDTERWYWDDGRNRFDMRQCQKYVQEKEKANTEEAAGFCRCTTSTTNPPYMTTS